MRRRSERNPAARAARARRAARNERIMLDLERYGGEILHSDEMEKAFQQTHHNWSTVGEHTLRVARASLALCYALRRLHIKTDIPAVVKASLCHDLGILGRYEKFSGNRECYRQHPVDSVKIARALANDLSEKSADIIERNMWLAAHSKRPSSLESVIVSSADKYASIKDFFLGSSIRHTGPKPLLHRILRRK